MNGDNFPSLLPANTYAPPKCFLSGLCFSFVAAHFPSSTLWWQCSRCEGVSCVFGAALCAAMTYPCVHVPIWDCGRVVGAVLAGRVCNAAPASIRNFEGDVCVCGGRPVSKRLRPPPPLPACYPLPPVDLPWCCLCVERLRTCILFLFARCSVALALLAAVVWGVVSRAPSSLKMAPPLFFLWFFGVLDVPCVQSGCRPSTSGCVPGVVKPTSWTCLVVEVSWGAGVVSGRRSGGTEVLGGRWLDVGNKKKRSD
jgi:hypothetical protein